MTPTHFQPRFWHKAVCGKVGVLRQTAEWAGVTCPACLLRKPDAETPEPDVVVEAKP